jgi:branched-chain amino acid transport system ATP-binding protein
MLKIHHLQAGYGASQVLFDVNLEMGDGEVVALLGRNGMGKTTTIKSILGIVGIRGGDVLVAGSSIAGLKTDEIARRGLGLVPEGRRVFKSLTVEENLLATARNGAGNWTLEAVYQLFPRLKERAANPARNLSGGEQQMLAIGRALMTNPRLLILDEATEGLAPIIRQQIWDALARLQARGLAILVVDKNLNALMRLADRHVIIEKGVTVWQGSPSALQAADDIRSRYLSV